MANDGIKITAPVGMTDIATVLGDSTDMARLEKIKDWSKNKPFEPHENPYVVQDDAARKKAAYGFHWWNVTQEEDAPFALAATYVFNKAIETNGVWFRKPITVSRIGDFDGYDHSAVLPYRYSDNTEGGDSDHWRILEMEMLNVSESNLVAESMPSVFGTEIADYSVRCIYRRQGSTDTNVVDSSYYVGDLSAVNKVTAEFKVPPTVEGEPHTYDYAWVATNADDSTAERIAWFYFPNGVGQFVYDGYYRMAYDAYSEIFEVLNVNGYPLTASSQYPKQISLFFDCFHNFNYEAGGKVVLHVWGREQGWDSGHDFEYDLTDDGLFEMREVNITNAIAGTVTAADAMMAISIYVRDEREAIITSPNYTAMHFDFENNKTRLGAATVSDGISMWRMVEIRDNFKA